MLNLCLSALNTANLMSNAYFVVFLVVSALIILLSIFGSLVQVYLYFNYHRSNRRQNALNLTGEETAKRVLNKLNLQDVQVKKASFIWAFFWGNSYSARRKTVYLRRGIFSKTSLTSVAVACQKVGLAQMDAEGDKAFKSRYWLAPFSLFGPTLVPFFILAGIIADIAVFETFGAFSIVAAVISLVLIILAAAFTFVQIPIEKKGVEYAKSYMAELSLINSDEMQIIDKYYKAYILDLKIAFIMRILEIIRAILRILISIMNNK